MKTVMRIAWMPVLLGLVAGGALAVQFSVNAQLRNFVGGPLVAATTSFFLGTLALLIASLVFRQSWPLGNAVTYAPWWVWAGGLLGAFYVLVTIILVPRIGAAATVGLILAGQVIASVVIDHFGLIQVPVHTLSAPRLTGTVLIIAGVALVQKF
jgi:transporter family-2 protein